MVEINELFEINTKVSEVKEPGFRIILGKVCNTKGSYSLSISSRNVFIKMMALANAKPDIEET